MEYLQLSENDSEGDEIDKNVQKGLDEENESDGVIDIARIIFGLSHHKKDIDILSDIK